MDSNSPSKQTKDTDSMVGKTIQSIKQQAINAWVFTFTDGTEKVIWGEIDGPFNLGQLWVSNAL